MACTFHLLQCTEDFNEKIIAEAVKTVPGNNISAFNGKTLWQKSRHNYEIISNVWE